MFTGNNKHIRELEMVSFHLNFINELIDEYYPGLRLFAILLKILYANKMYYSWKL